MKKKYLSNIIFIFFAFCVISGITPSCSSKIFSSDKEGITYNNYGNTRNKHVLSYHSTNSQTIDFTIECPDRRKINSKELYGQWILLYFWSPMSGWSVEGLNGIEQVQEQFADVMTTICLECYSINQAPKDQIKIDTVTNHLIMAKCNEKSSLFKYLKIRGFPTRVLINTHGKIVEVIEGENHDGFPNEIRDYLKHLQVKIR